MTELKDVAHTTIEVGDCLVHIRSTGYSNRPSLTFGMVLYSRPIKRDKDTGLQRPAGPVVVNINEHGVASGPHMLSMGDRILVIPALSKADGGLIPNKVLKALISWKDKYGV
jgi:hypothetical protein